MLDVSRETRERLEVYESLLRKWQSHINLVSEGTLEDLWERHFMDSAQLFSLIPDPSAPLVDLGSGAGFPGAVLAIMGCSSVTLIERDQRKCSFLRALSRELHHCFQVYEGDVLHYDGPVSVLTSRALASVSHLLSLSKSLVRPDTLCLFLKGKEVDQELRDVPSEIQMTTRKFPSITSKEGCVLELKNIVIP